MQHKGKRTQTQSAGFLQSDSAGFRLITGLLKQKEKTEITAHLLLSFRPTACLFFVFVPVYSLVKSMCEPPLVLHSLSHFFSLSVTFTVCGHLFQNGLRLVLLPIQIMLFTSCCDVLWKLQLIMWTHGVMPLNSAIVSQPFCPP